MAETSYPWNAAPLVGDASLSPYDAENEFAEWVSTLSGSWGWIYSKSGIFQDESTQLAPVASAGQITFDTGRAVVYGTLYKNNGFVNIPIPTPSGSTRIDLIVLRKDWTLKTVRITRIAGVEGGPAPDSLFVLGDKVDMELATAEINTVGSITLVDRRSSTVHSQFLMPQYPHICLLQQAPWGAPGDLVTADGSFSMVLFNSTMYKSVDGMHSTVSNQGRVNILQQGVYEITARFIWGPGSSAGTRLIQIWKNGTVWANDFAYMYQDVTAGLFTPIDHRIPPFRARLAVGDYIQMAVWQNGGGATITTVEMGQATLQVSQVGP